MLSVSMSVNERSKALLTNATNPRKWCSTVKTAVLGGSSSLSPLLDRGGRLVWSADEKTQLFSAYLYAKQCRNIFQQPYPCDRCPILRSVACRLPLYLDPYGGNDTDGMFPLFYKQVAWELAPKLALIFRHRVRGGGFRNVGD